LDEVELGGFAELMADLAVSFARTPTGAQRSDLISDMVDGAVTIIPGVRAAAVLTVTGNGLLAAPVIRGDDTARAVMDAQNRWGQGPSLDAWRDNKQVVLLDVFADPRWPEFSGSMAGLGVRSMVCTPITVKHARAGVLSLMGDGIDFDDADEDTAMMARVFAAHAGLAMTGEQRSADATAALSTRDVIGQAKGILMERFGLTAEAAFAVLVKASSETNTKLRTVCEQLCLTGTLAAQSPRSR
jgi:hypothetical protein